MTLHETLKAMRELLSDEKRWTQGENARTAKGNEAGPLSRHATCWCLEGALMKVNGGVSYRAFSELTEVLGVGPSDFNDTHTHAEVIAKLDEAIEATRS